MSAAIKISDFCETSSGGTPSRDKEKLYYGGSIPWVKSGELRENVVLDTEEKITELALKESSAKLVSKGSILLAMYGATVGRMATLGIDAATNQAVCAIKPDGKRADVRYVFHALQKRVPDFLRNAKGGAQPNISLGMIRDTKIYLPSLEEQKRIAAVLDKADELRRKRREAMQLADDFLRAVFLEMFGDPVTNPKRWPVKKLAEVGALDRGVSKHRPRNDPSLLGGPHPLIQTGEVANCDGYIRSHTATYSDKGLRQSKMWPAGTLCITIAANIAKTGILRFDACFPDSVVGFSAGASATIEYVRFWLSFLQKTLEESAPESAQKNINLAILRNLNIPLPPIGQLRRFEQIVMSFEQMRLSHRMASVEIDSLSSTLQSEAFS